MPAQNRRPLGQRLLRWLISITLRLILIAVFCVVMYNVLHQVLIPLYENTVSDSATTSVPATVQP